MFDDRNSCRIKSFQYEKIIRIQTHAFFTILMAANLLISLVSLRLSEWIDHIPTVKAPMEKAC